VASFDLRLDPAILLIGQCDCLANGTHLFPSVDASIFILLVHYESTQGLLQAETTGP
jgi:hypothetical protein